MHRQEHKEAEGVIGRIPFAKAVQNDNVNCGGDKYEYRIVATDPLDHGSVTDESGFVPWITPVVCISLFENRYKFLINSVINVAVISDVSS